MEEELGDWIYILIIVIAGVGGLISSMRKKAQQTAELNKPREIIAESSDEKDFWGDYIPQSEKKQASKTKPKMSATSSLKPNPSFNFYQEGQPSLTPEEAEDALFSDTSEEGATFTIDDIPTDAAEWRKVFIYNEIFSRKNG